MMEFPELYSGEDVRLHKIKLPYSTTRYIMISRSTIAFAGSSPVSRDRFKTFPIPYQHPNISHYRNMKNVRNKIYGR